MIAAPRVLTMYKGAHRTIVCMGQFKAFEEEALGASQHRQAGRFENSLSGCIAVEVGQIEELGHWFSKALQPVTHDALVETTVIGR